MRQKIYSLFLFVSIGLLILSTEFGFGQGVSINATGNSPDAQSILDIESTTRGILLPRMTVVQRDAINPSADDHGMMIYNLTDSQYNYWDGSSWQAVGSGTVNFLDDAYDGGGAGVGRTITADAGAVNIQGTDGLHVSGNVGIGNTNPLVSLQINAMDAILLPKGTTAQRPTGVLGYIRYNTQANQFEGFGAGNAWGSLGGVIDIDQDTKVEAEANPNEDKLRFTTAATERMVIDDLGSVGIGNSAPDGDALFEITSTTKGVLLPRMTTVQRTNITPNAGADFGLMVYDTDIAAYSYWDGTAWQVVGNGAANSLDDAYDGGGSGIGRIINADAGTVDIQGAGGLLVNGTTGIGTPTPDASSILDVSSNSKGFLMPRLSTVERDAIANPATGLMIYNHTLNDGQLNIGIPSAPIWTGINEPYADPVINSVTEGGDIGNSSTTNLLVLGMTLSPVSGSYMVSFNAQMTSSQTFSSNQGVIDVNGIYNDLMSEPGGVAHGLVFGSEVLTPGVYDVAGAASIAGTLTLDGEGDPNAVFIIRATGAFTTGAGTIVNLIGGASSNNIFWVSEVAMSTGAPTTMYGTLVSHGAAVSLGADTDLEGRMFTTTGAITMGAGSTLTAPTGASYIDLGVLSSFVMFTPSGAISGCATCAVTGDVSTAAGAISAFDGIVGTVYAPGTEPTANTTTYSIYQNGLELVNSSRLIKLYQSTQSIVSLQGMVTVTTGDAIEIRWKVDVGESILSHRTLSMVRSGS